MEPISIIIPTYNGLELLRKYLPTVVEAFKNYGAGEIVVVDDGSSDGTPEIIAEEFPQATLLKNAENLGFAHSINRGVKEAKYDVVVLL